MNVLTLSEFDMLEELFGTEQLTAFHARDTRSGRDVRLTLFGRKLSEMQQFRAAFRKDRTQLENLHHDTILQYLGYGEADGALFFFAEYSGERSLQHRLDQGQQFSWDEIADLGWQIASALQYAHNFGLSHAGLTTSSVLVTEALRVKVAGFGVHRWIAAATHNYEKHTEADWLNSQSADLVALGGILERLVAACSDAADGSDSAGGSVRAEVEGLVNDLRSPDTPGFPTQARDVQGRLGNLLLSVAGESIEIVDHRAGQSYGRRSIVDELFDEPETPSKSIPRPAASVKPDDRNSLAVVIAAIVIVLVVVAIVLLRGGE